MTILDLIHAIGDIKLLTVLLAVPVGAAAFLLWLAVVMMVDSMRR